MARAKRHFIPGYIWHITYRCHKREFLLKFAKDRHRYLQWLYQARKKYGLKILNYMVTSNHIHFDYERLQGMVGAKFYDQLRRSHKGWVEKYLGDDAKERQDEWTALQWGAGSSLRM